jgi:hypothetical protein
LIGARLAVADRCVTREQLLPRVRRSMCAGFREPAVCAIATEVLTRASSAIVVINFRMLGFQRGSPHDDGNGKLDHKVRQASRFVQILQRTGDGGQNLGGFGLGLSAKAAGRNPGIVRTRRGEGPRDGGGDLAVRASWAFQACT